MILTAFSNNDMMFMKWLGRHKTRDFPIMKSIRPAFLEGRDFMIQNRNITFPVTVFDNLNSLQTNKLGISDHHHDSFEFFHLHQGRILIILDGTSHYMESDQCICILPGTVHSIHSVSGQPFFYSTIQFRPDLLLKDLAGFCGLPFYQKLLDHSLPVETIIRKTFQSGQIFLELYHHLFLLLKEKPYGYEIGAKGYLELMMYQLFRSSKPIYQEESEKNDLQMVYEFIESNYMNNITIDTLAVLSNMSKYYFIRYFRKAAGQTPIEYINSVRIQKACELLKENSMKILDIAIAVGIQDLSYFNRLFKRIMGITPTKYRAQAEQCATEQRALYYEEESEDVPFYSYTY